MRLHRSLAVLGLVSACCLVANVLLTSRVQAESRRAKDLHVDFSVGLGLGGRAIERPTLGGTQRIGPGHFPVADVGLRVEAWPENAWSLAFVLRYQTTLFDTAIEHPPLSPANELRVRSHHAEVAAFPIWHFATNNRWAFGAGLGYALRVFWPDVHNLQTPRQVISGPFLRPELQVSKLGPLSLRVGPELLWILTTDQALKNAVDTRQALAIGGQVSVVADLGDSWALEAMYRESHVLLVAGLEDMERYLSLTVTRKF
jgi:hypothetical protein